MGEWGSEARPRSHARMQQTPNMGNPPLHFEATNDYLIIRKDKMGTDRHPVEMVGNIGAPTPVQPLPIVRMTECST